MGHEKGIFNDVQCLDMRSIHSREGRIDLDAQQPTLTVVRQRHRLDHRRVARVAREFDDRARLYQPVERVQQLCGQPIVLPGPREARTIVPNAERLP